MKAIAQLSEGRPEAFAEDFKSGKLDTRGTSITEIRTTTIAFVIMKFDDELLDSAYEGVFKPLLSEFGYFPIRIDEIQDSGKITDQTLESIREARIVLADLTGERPNCYYETGYAHALEKEMIFTIKEGEKIHFDLVQHRFIRWNTEKSLRDQLRDRLEAIQEREV